MTQYSKEVLQGYHQNSNGGHHHNGQRRGTSETAKIGLFSSPLSPYTMTSSFRTLSQGFAPLRQASPPRLGSTGGGGLRWPPGEWPPRTLSQRRLLRRLMRKWPLGFLLLLAADKAFPPGWPGWGAIDAVWRNPAQEPLGFKPGDFVPNPFDHQASWGPPWVALLDKNTCALPLGCQFWGDFPGADPTITAPAEADPFQPVPSPMPFRFDENSPLTQLGPHPLADPLPRRYATVNRQSDYVTAPPGITPLGPLPPGVSPPAVSQKKPHTRQRPRSQDKKQAEVKLSSRVARILTRFFDFEEIVDIMDRIVQILREPDYHIFLKGGSKWYVRNRKVARIAKLLGKEVAEDLIIRAIKPKSPFDDRWMFQ